MAKERFALKGVFMKGRQALKMVYDHYNISETEGSLFELQDLLKVTLKGDNLRAFHGLGTCSDRNEPSSR